VTGRREDHPRELLSAYLDGELTGAEQAAVAAHVADCASCRTLLDDYRALAASATREEPPPFPVDLRSRIRLSLEARRTSEAPRHGRRIGSYRLGLAAAAGIVLVIGLWATRREPVPPPSSPIASSAAPDTRGRSDRDKDEKDSMPPPAVPAKPGEAGSLRSLGYVGSESKKSAGAPPPVIAEAVGERETLETRPAGEARRFAAPPAQTGTAPAAAATPENDAPREKAAETGTGLARQQAGSPAIAPRSAPIGRPGSVLQFTYPTHAVRVHEDGTVTLSSQSYTCAVRQDGRSVDPDIAALFALAASAGELGVVPAPERRAAAVVRLLAPRRAGEESTDEAPEVELPATKGRAIETRLWSLLQDRYLSLMESRCGPVPRIVRSP
jgi:putative zinc finger protein